MPPYCHQIKHYRINQFQMVTGKYCIAAKSNYLPSSLNGTQDLRLCIKVKAQREKALQA